MQKKSNDWNAARTRTETASAYAAVSISTCPRSIFEISQGSIRHNGVFTHKPDLARHSFAKRSTDKGRKALTASRYPRIGEIGDAVTHIIYENLSAEKNKSPTHLLPQ